MRGMLGTAAPMLLVLAMAAGNAQACYAGFFDFDVGAVSAPDGLHIGGLFIRGPCDGTVHVIGRGSVHDEFDARIESTGLCGGAAFCEASLQELQFHVTNATIGVDLQGAVHRAPAFGHQAVLVLAGELRGDPAAFLHLQATE